MFDLCNRLERRTTREWRDRWRRAPGWERCRYRARSWAVWCGPWTSSCAARWSAGSAGGVCCPAACQHHQRRLGYYQRGSGAAVRSTATASPFRCVYAHSPSRPGPFPPNLKLFDPLVQVSHHWGNFSHFFGVFLRWNQAKLWFKRSKYLYMLI